MSGIGARLKSGLGIERSILDGTMQRVRPVVMTGLVPALGFVPMAVATGTGAEVQRPQATVVIDGLITPTALTVQRAGHAGLRYASHQKSATVCWPIIAPRKRGMCLALQRFREPSSAYGRMSA